MPTSFEERVEFRWYQLGIIGSGPAGLSAAAHAAELGVAHVLLEAEQHPSNTIHKYQKGKHVMAEPQILPLRSPLTFEAGKREAVLAAWEGEAAKLGVNAALERVHATVRDDEKFRPERFREALAALGRILER